ncbi:RNase H-like domain found in reverse transcriptase [Popillia japonica]|uniref:RNase H-like domain found in reverse transcriptase n=1 Tax=Popillia japonica TaxID=7064 RepID=A0AAW1K158_POPJA
MYIIIRSGPSICSVLSVLLTLLALSNLATEYRRASLERRIDFVDCFISALGRADEESRKQVKVMAAGTHNGSTLEVNKMKIQAYKKRQEGKKENKHNSKQKSSKCQRCEMQHDFGKCPAWGQTCNKCKRPNHFARCCRTKNICEIGNNDTSGNVEIDNTELETLNLGSITEANKPYPVCNIIENGAREWMEKIQVGSNLLVNFKLDTGSEANILPKQDNYEPILGLKACVALNLIQRIYSTAETDTKKYETASSILNAFKDVFAGVGCFGKPCTIKLKEGAIPSISRCRKIPLALHKTVKEALIKLEKEKIVSKVEEATDWLNAMVVTEKKDGTVRLCMDPRPLNKYIVRQRLELPTFETPRLSPTRIHILDERIEAIQKMKRPANVKELQTFLGMINYLSRFINNIAKETAPLRLLLKKESVWSWDDNSPQECAFRKLKNLISEAPVLSYYNPNLPVTLATDASQFGLGGHISQEGHPVAYW